MSDMKLSQRTIDLLKNFAGINPSMLFLPGNNIQTVAIAKNAFARAEVAETFPQRFALYSLPEFLGILSLLPDPSIEFHENYMVIKSGKQKVRYHYAAENLIVVPPEGKQIKLATVDAKLTLTQDVLAQIEKVAAVMKFDAIAITKDGVKAFDTASTKNSGSTNVFDVDVDVDTESQSEFRIKIANMKMLPGDYRVEISEKGITQFTNVADENLVYNIPLEK